MTTRFTDKKKNTIKALLLASVGVLVSLWVTMKVVSYLYPPVVKDGRASARAYIEKQMKYNNKKETGAKDETKSNPATGMNPNNMGSHF